MEQQEKLNPVQIFLWLCIVILSFGAIIGAATWSDSRRECNPLEYKQLKEYTTHRETQALAVLALLDEKLTVAEFKEIKDLDWKLTKTDYKNEALDAYEKAFFDSIKEKK